MEEESRHEGSNRRARMWQNFEVYLQVPEPVCCPEQYWFMIDEYSVPNLLDNGKDGKTGSAEMTRTSHRRVPIQGTA